MKIINKLALFLVLELFLQPLLADARDIYLAHWRGKAYTTDSTTGQVVSRKYSEQEIIEKCARDNGIEDINALAYVYVANEQNTEVVWKDTGATVCEIFQFEYSHTDAIAADNHEAVRHAFIFDEAHD